MADNDRTMDLETLLRDPMTRSIIAGLAVCAAFFYFFIGQWWWRRKILSYTASEVRLLRVHREVKERVQILFDGNPAKDVTLAVITVSNSGHEVIRANDFERPLKVAFGLEAEILSIEIADTRPHNLRPQVKSVSDGFVLDPLLLNKGDWIKFKILVNRMTGRRERDQACKR
jgi:hypothetical protein